MCDYDCRENSLPDDTEDVIENQDNPDDSEEESISEDTIEKLKELEDQDEELSLEDIEKDQTGPSSDDEEEHNEYQ